MLQSLSINPDETRADRPLMTIVIDLQQFVTERRDEKRNTGLVREAPTRTRKYQQQMSFI